MNIASDWSGDRGKHWLSGLEHMESMLEPFDDFLIQALELEPGVRVAEIGCGGGATSRRLAAECGSTVHVLGVDISADLINAARTAASSLNNIDYRVADAATADAPDPACDRLTSRFGIMFFDNPAEVFSNLASWLKPGGRFAFAVWGALADNPWMLMARDAVQSVIDIPRPEPDAPGPFRYANAEKLLALLSDAGFVDVAARSRQQPLALGGGMSGDAAAAFALGAFSFAEPLQSLDNEYAQALATLSAAYAEFEENGVVRVPAAVHIVTGGL